MEFRPVFKKQKLVEVPASAPDTHKVGLLIVKTANQTIQDAMEQPIPEQLCGIFWYEGEVCILFADKNIFPFGDEAGLGQSEHEVPVKITLRQVLYFFNGCLIAEFCGFDSRQRSVMLSVKTF